MDNNSEKCTQFMNPFFILRISLADINQFLQSYKESETSFL